MSNLFNYRSFFTKESTEERSYWGSKASGCIFIAKNTGRILLFKRSKYVNEPGTWSSVGGKLDAGESPKEAVKREIEEETGYSGDYKVSLLYVYQDGDFKYYNYLTIVDFEFMPELNWENDNSQWIDFGDWPAPLHFGLKELFKHAGHKIKTIVDILKKRNDKLSESIDAPPPSIQQNVQAFSPDFINYIKTVENGVRSGFKNGKWYPHKSPEGGRPTIAYGHKLKAGENFDNGITEKEAEQLLVGDLVNAKKIVDRYHKAWVNNFIKKGLEYVKQSSSNAPNYQFFANLKPTDPVFKLNQKQNEILLDYVFNLGSLKSFPKLAQAVFRNDWEGVKKEYKRTYKDAQGNRHELGRNKTFFNRYLKENSMTPPSNHSYNISLSDVGMIDDGVWAYEMKSPYSTMRYGYEPDAKTFYLFSIITPNPDDQNKGHSKQLLERLFLLINQKRGNLDVGSYTTSGMSYVKPVVDRLCKQYNVRLVKGREIDL